MCYRFMREIVYLGNGTFRIVGARIGYHIVPSSLRSALYISFLSFVCNRHSNINNVSLCSGKDVWTHIHEQHTFLISNWFLHLQQAFHHTYQRKQSFDALIRLYAFLNWSVRSILRNEHSWIHQWICAFQFCER